MYVPAPIFCSAISCINSLTFFKDTGGSKLIAEGKIKLKSDSQIESFTETGIKFENGTELAADVVVFATG